MSDSLLIMAQIMLLNLVLSADNALVIGMASRKLPAHQRKLAYLIGTSLAVGLRILFTFGAVLVLQIPFLKLCGGLLLLWLAWKLLLPNETTPHLKPTAHLFGALWLIAGADLVMSLDNVLALAAVADGQLGYIIAGIALSIPLMVWGSRFVIHLLERFPIFHYLGAGLLAYTAGTLFIADESLKAFYLLGHESVQLGLPVALAVIVLISARYCHKLDKIS
jgi:YjbE family integral membrane protein